MKKTGLILAAAAASLFVAGCATQADNMAQPQPAPMAAQPMAPDVTPHYKGGNSCKTMMKKHHMMKKKMMSSDASGSASTSTDSTGSSMQ